jgi:hypothetical protein
MVLETINLPTPTNFRYERKFVITAMSRYEVESIIKLHPAMFSETYHQRFVNNIYLDTHSFSNYFNNEDGISERVKTRVRWYSDLFGPIPKPVLEMKTKKGFLGGKLRYPLNPFRLDKDCSLEVLQCVFDQSDLPSLLRERLTSLDFALLNRYSRKYFESADHKFRITLDFDLEYFRIDTSCNSFIERLTDEQKVILELKYDQADDDQARSVTNHLPFRLTKNSKYVMGIQSLHNPSF